MKIEKSIEYALFLIQAFSPKILTKKSLEFSRKNYTVLSRIVWRSFQYQCSATLQNDSSSTNQRFANFLKVFSSNRNFTPRSV